MNTIKNIGISIILLIGGVILGYVMFSGGPATGGTTNYDDLSVDSITVSGASTLATATLSSTLGVTATTTLSDTVNFNNAGICINLYATSTATRMHMTASSTSLVNGVSTGVMLLDYGACSN